MLLADQPHSASNHSHAGVRRLAAADGQVPTDIHTRASAAAPTAPAGRGTDAPPRPGSRRVTPVPLTVPPAAGDRRPLTGRLATSCGGSPAARDHRHGLVLRCIVVVAIRANGRSGSI